MVEITAPKQRHGFQKGQSGNPAGKPRGTLNKDTRAIMEAAEATGRAPLAIMLEAMHKAWDSGDIESATKYAALAAPYCHPRLQSVEHAGKPEKPVKLEVCWRSEPREHNQQPEWARDVAYAPPPKVY